MKIYGRNTGPSGTPETVKVGMADYAVGAKATTFSTSGLGSCVGVALYDHRTDVGGLAHIMLPSSKEIDDDNEAKFADTAIEAMLTEMADHGVRRGSVRAKIAGGSNVLDFTSIDGAIGTRNVEAVRSVLDSHGAVLDAEDVGGSHGRSLQFDSETAILTVRSAAQGVKEL